jgi:histidinol-phosphatase (PHP family)
VLLSNYHTHTLFCDGIEAPEEYTLSAIKNNLYSLGYSAHAPVPFHCEWPLPIERLEEYITAINRLKERYGQKLEIYNGLEIDYIPNLWPEMKGKIKPERFDFTIGSIHFIDTYADGKPWTIDGNNTDFLHGLETIFRNNNHEVFRRYFDYTREMVRVMKPTIIGHIDKLKMQYYNSSLNPNEDKVYQQEFLNTLEEIADSNSIVEINTRGIYRRNEKEYYPGIWAMKAMARMKIKVTVNSDAHRPTELINHWKEAHTMLHDAGFKSVQILKKGKWEEQEIEQ